MLVLLMAVISLGRMNAQVITVSGTVTDAKDGNPLVGCSVQIKGTSKGAITNMKGQYTIQAKKGETLLFQYIGYKQERRVVKSATLDVKMKADDVVLEECVVVGYGHELKATKSMSAAYMAVCPTPGIMYDAVNAEEYVSLFIRYTRMGKAMRATAQNRKMALLLGINADRIISLTFIVGSALAALGGVLIASHMGQVNFGIGFLAGLKAFTAAVLGGIGSIPGAMVGGLVLGIAESMTTGYLSGNYEDALAFALLILILIFRPDGILGKAKVQKV